jgi:hypothetical protein
MKKNIRFDKKKIGNDLEKVISLLSETNFNVTLFLKRIDEKLNSNKKKFVRIDVLDEIYYSWSTCLSKAKLNQKILNLKKYLNHDFNSYLYEDGNLLPWVNDNFQLIKVIKPKNAIFDGDFENYINFQIISSYENKSFYILESNHKGKEGIFSLDFIKKTIKVKEAIGYIKKEIAQLNREDKENRRWYNKKNYPN